MAPDAGAGSTGGSGSDAHASGGSGAGGGTGSPAAGGAGGEEQLCPDERSRFVSEVTDHAFGSGQDFGQAAFPDPIFGPPRGTGCCEGSTDVVSLGNGGHVVLAFDVTIVDGPGADFIVFENAFNVGQNEMQPFAELGTVSVSDDGETWFEFPCTATSYPYDSCAGWHPVYANADDNDIDPLDVAAAGGDPFDLADIGVDQARYVRIVDRVDQTGQAGVFDLDAVGVVHADCP